MRVVLRLIVLLSALATLPAQEFRSASVTVEEGPFAGRSFRYRVHVPDDLGADERVPVLLFLHGAGERGDDNEAQLRHLPEKLVRPEYRRRFRSIVVAPQCARGAMWMKVDWQKRESEQATADSPWLDVALACLLKTLGEEEACDPERIYLTGLSMGGFGSWHLAARAPRLFAAVVPVCGGGDPAEAARLARLPFSVWHGAADTVVPPERSRTMVGAVRAAGGTAHYVELPGVAHDSWTAAYRLEGAALDWLFARRRGEAYAGRAMACDAEQARVVLLALDRAADDPRRVVWAWAGEGLSEEQRAVFGTPIDVQPVDLATAVLVATDAGGLFRVRFADRRVEATRQLDAPPRALAALDDGSVVLAGAEGLARLAPDFAGEPRQAIALDGADGLHWDSASRTLWALTAAEVVGFALDEGGDLVEKGRFPREADLDTRIYAGLELEGALPGARIVRLRPWP
jgi:poly(3-hydroxybutyrate) depolymerase